MSYLQKVGMSDGEAADYLNIDKYIAQKQEDIANLSDQLGVAANSLRQNYAYLLPSADDLTEAQKVIREGLLDTAVENLWDTTTFEDAYEELENIDASEIIDLRLDESLTDEEYREQALKIYEKLAKQFNLSDNAQQAFKVSFGLDEQSIKEAAETRFNNETLIREKLGVGLKMNGFWEEKSEIQTWLSSLSDEKIAILAEAGFNEDASLKDLREVLAKAQSVANASPVEATLLFESEGLNAQVDEYQDKMSSLADAIAKMTTGELTSSEKLDLIQEFPELENHIDDLSTGLDTLANENFEALIEAMKDAGASDAIIQLMRDIRSESELAASGVESLSDAVDKATSSKDALKNWQSGDRSGETINSLMDSYPQLTSLLLDYLRGKATEADIEKALSELYETDYKNMQLYYIEKMKLDEGFYNEVKANISQEIKDLAKAYDIDLDNFTSLASAKATVESKLIEGLAKKWSEYYSALYKTLGKGNAELGKELSYTQNADGSRNKAVHAALVSQYDYLKNISSNAQSIIAELEKVSLDLTSDLNIDSLLSSSASNTVETFDWIETKLTRVQRKIENFGKTAAATYKSWSTRNKALASELTKVSEEIEVQTDAYEYYLKKANSVNLAKGYKEKVRLGLISIEDISDETLKENIKKYQEWYEKYLEAYDAIQDLTDELANLAKEKFDNVASEYDSVLGVIEHRASMIDAYIEGIEAKGHLVGEEYYQSLAKIEQENIAMLEKEYAALQTALATAMAEGNIAQGSEEWYAMMETIYGVEEALQEAKNSMQEYINSMRQAEWDIFDKQQEHISNLISESEFLIDLLDNNDLFDEETGNITEYGQAALGLHAVDYNVYMAQADEYAKEIEEINKELAEDPYNDKLLERRNELLESQREAILNAEAEKEAIKNLVKESYEAMLNALQEIIDKRKEALQAEED